ncbi:MAG: Gfo/Idh/MocA family oxidoreductase [Candidatus Latescibacterota bacterium]|nr:Gfo/Idh/MocA family oxidoreductase [Candidatus Latescibacterota bacterium]
MADPFRMAVIGVGRIGVFHARHVQELARARGDCVLAAVVDGYGDLAERVATELQLDQETPIGIFKDVEALVAAAVVDGAFIASRTENHYRDARTLIDAGLRVLLEKPLTHSLETARAFAEYLDADDFRRTALMQAFMRRFDAPLLCAKEQLDRGTVGTPFKMVSILEDPLPPPQGYNSSGLLPDMAVHNIDEILWLGGQRPERVAGFGSLLYNQQITDVKEDFDDAFLQLYFPGALVGQVVVSRNHVAGYRNETWVYGTEGVVHVGAFGADPLRVDVEVLGRRGPIDRRAFTLRDYGAEVPVFIERFGPAYKAELAHYIDQCRSGAPFDVDHGDGLRALEVAVVGSGALRGKEGGVEVNLFRCD